MAAPQLSLSQHWGTIFMPTAAGQQGEAFLTRVF